MSRGHGHGSAECREIFARLSEYLDAELDVELCDRIEHHMADCAPCQAFLESLRRTVALTRRLPELELPAELRDELMRAYRKAREEPRQD